MKWHSLIFLCVTLFFLRCQKPDAKEETLILEQLQQSYAPGHSVTERLQIVRNALLRAEKTANDSILFKAAAIEYDIIREYYPDSSETYLSKLKYLIKDSKQKSSFLLREADYLKETKQHHKAYNCYKEAKIQAEITKDSIKTAYILLGMAEIANVFNDYSGSQETVTEALAYLKNGKRKDYEMRAHNLLGLAYANLQEYEKANESYQNALNIHDDALGKDIIRNNIAHVYILDMQYQKAGVLLDALLQHKTIRANPAELARVLHNSGYAAHKNEQGAGINKMLKATKIREAIGEYADLPYSYLDLSDYYKTDNPVLAHQYSLKALEIAKKVNSIDQRIDALIQLIKLSDGTESKRLFLEYERLNDSITTVRRIAKNEFAKQKYDFRKSDLENTALKIRNLRSEQQKLLYGIAIGLLIIASFILFYLIRKRHIKARRLEAYNTETRISKKIHDELANDVFYTMAFAEQQDLAAAENRETLLNNLDNIYSRTRDISRENTIIDTGENFGVELKNLLFGYNTQQVTIIVIGMEAIPWQTLSLPLQIKLYRILQELLTNMKKHSNCSRAVFSFRLIKKKITVEYSDDGIGAFLTGKISEKKFVIMENRIREINGVLTFDPTTGKGFRLSFTFPQKQ